MAHRYSVIANEYSDIFDEEGDTKTNLTYEVIYNLLMKSVTLFSALATTKYIEISENDIDIFLYFRKYIQEDENIKQILKNKNEMALHDYMNHKIEYFQKIFKRMNDKLNE